MENTNEKVTRNDVGNRIYLYGLDGDNQVVRYGYVKDQGKIIENAKAQAERLREAYPAIERVFMADNSYDLYQAAQDAIKNRSLENIVVLKIMLETRGMQVL